MNWLFSESSNKSLFFGLIFSFWAFFMLMAVFNQEGLLSVFEFEKDLMALQIKNSLLAEENRHIKSEIKALKKKPSEIEKVAREKLNLVKPGDKVFHFIRPS